MIITVDIPDMINRKLEALKRKQGVSKSHLVRTVLTEYVKNLNIEKGRVGA